MATETPDLAPGPGSDGPQIDFSELQAYCRGWVGAARTVCASCGTRRPFAAEPTLERRSHQVDRQGRLHVEVVVAPDSTWTELRRADGWVGVLCPDCVNKVLGFDEEP